MNPWNESFELLKSIEDSSDLNKGPTGPIGTFIKKILRKIGILLKEQVPRINKKIGQVSRIHPEANDPVKGAARRSRISESAKREAELAVAREKYDAGSQMTLSEYKSLQNAGVIRKDKLRPIEELAVNPAGKRKTPDFGGAPKKKSRPWDHWEGWKKD